VATHEAQFISYCRLLPPRKIAKFFSANGMIGRGSGDRNCIPTKQVLHGQWHSATARFQLLLNVVKLLIAPIPAIVQTGV
jgi:hypothetical protein